LPIDKQRALYARPRLAHATAPASALATTRPDHPR
jgi:hypothetical protein